jgi:hypothetical protein
VFIHHFYFEIVCGAAKMISKSLIISLFFGYVQLAVLSFGYSCPEYSQIEQPSVDSSVFDISEFGGLWYMVATNEPTMPSFCRCGINEVVVNKAAGVYGYTNIDYCDEGMLKRNISLTIKGDLSKDPSTPGALHETAAFWNHTIGSLLPNYIFDVRRSSSGIIDTLFTYACLGKVLGFGPELFSFNILSRTYQHDSASIFELVSSATKKTNGLLNVDGLRLNNFTSYKTCGIA